ncbi:30S ribosomal protein S8 [Patescibacteria group bacterium]|nr:30S ribosomal protein S8 [Patescibacteria group bacterium]
MVNDPIGDFIIQLKNASAVKKKNIIVPYSKFKFEVAQKLEKEGYLKAVTKRGKKARKCVEVEIVYDNDDESKIHGVSRISKPSRRIYQSVSEIRPVLRGKGNLVLSTPKGILTGAEARKKRVGGEVLFKIW